MMFPLKGIIPPLVTPLTNDQQLDRGALEQVIERCLAAGVQGLFALGTTGEGPALGHRLRREVIRATVDIAAGRAPVLAGVTDSAISDALELAGFAAECGAASVVTAGPTYFPASQGDLVRYLRQFAAESPLPVFLYNMPSHTKVSFSVETVLCLADVPNIVGVKDSSGQMLYFQQLLAVISQRADFTVLIGPEELLAEAVLLGAHGGVCGGANLVPELYVELFEAALVGDLRRMLKLQQRVQRLAARLYTVEPSPSAYLAGLKGALACLGIGNGLPAPPAESLLPKHRRVIEQHLRDLGLEVADAPARDSR